jgi:A/G-specific adenine glycosylase
VSLEPQQILDFRRQLLHWYRQAKRDLPWRRNVDPYSVWVSEIMLQQTRVVAAIPYYHRFLARYPDFYRLAESAEADLLEHWAGLGYYYRARFMQRAAQSMAAEGRFPSTYNEIRALPGVGDYTAAAIASISFNLPHAVVDGNVYRVLSRIDDDSTDIASTTGKKRFAALAATLLDRSHPGEYNQALMELGATICLPKNPQCLICPVSGLCIAKAKGRQNELPLKTKSQKTVDEQRVVYWIEDRGHLLLWQRPPDASLMPGFWELPEPQQLPEVEVTATIGSFRHGITFHNYVFTVQSARQPALIGGCQWIPIRQIREFSVSDDFEEQVSRIPLSTIARKAARLVAKAKQTFKAAT